MIRYIVSKTSREQKCRNLLFLYLSAPLRDDERGGRMQEGAGWRERRGVPQDLSDFSFICCGSRGGGGGCSNTAK